MKFFSLLNKFFIMYYKSSEEKVQPIQGGTYDILFSVWNVFRNREQREGFIRNNLTVHWVGNHYPPKKGTITKRSFSFLSFFLLCSSYFLKLGYLGVFSSMWAFNLFSGTRSLNAKLVWAYVEFNPLLLRRAKKRGIPIVLDNPIAHMEKYYEDLETVYKECGQKFHSWWVRKWVNVAKKEYELADWFNVGSNFVKETLIERGVPSEKIIVTHTGVDVELWSKSYLNKEKTSTFVFVFTAGISPRKGIQYLMKAWKQLNLQDAELWICGGHKKTMNWDLICGGVPNNVVFLGRLKHEQLSKIYSKANVYILPSLLEGFARSGLEALAAGLPVIITKETGLTDFVTDGHEGWVVPARSVTSLIERMQWCYLNKNKVEQAGERAYNKMRNQSFSVYGDKCADIAKAIINGKNPIL